MKIARGLALFLVVGGAAAYSLFTSGSRTPSKSLDRRSFVGAAAAATLATRVAPASAEDDPYADFTTTESGMKYKILKEGDGAIPLPNQTVKAVSLH